MEVREEYVPSLGGRMVVNIKSAGTRGGESV